MSSQDCQSGDITGFPIVFSQNLNNPWPQVDPSNQASKLKGLTVPTDFTVNWAPPAQTTISIRQNTDIFQINGLDSIAAGTSLTYGPATYTCSSILSIVKNQHSNLYNLPANSGATYEVILAFEINNKSQNPSSPDIILMCRPMIFSTWNSSPFWASVNEAVLRKNNQQTTLDMSTLYGYNSSTLFPMVTYQTCLSTKLLNPNANGSIKVRVHLATQPIYVIADTNGIAMCSSVTKYIFTTSPKRLVDVFSGLNGFSIGGNTKIQFKDGTGSDGFPNGANVAGDNLTPLPAATAISDFNTAINKIIILVPQQFLGKSLADLSDINQPKPVAPKKKAFKCYTIDPTKDIVDNQIMVDPATGQPLSDTLKKEALEAAGGDPSLVGINGLPPVPPSGLMPGDIQNIMIILITIILTVFLSVYFIYIGYLLINKKDHINAIKNFGYFSIILVILVILALYFSKG